MASKRSDIMVQVCSALANIAEICYVSESVSHWEELDHGKFPALFPIDADETKTPVVLFDGTQNDMRAVMTVIVTGMVYSATNDTSVKRLDLMQKVEKALVTATGLTSIIHGILPTRVITDKGALENYSVWDQEFEIEYWYPYEDGG